MLVVAIISLAVHGLNAVLVHSDSQHDINLRGAFLHVIADTISSVGVIWPRSPFGCATGSGPMARMRCAHYAIGLLVALSIGLGAIPLIRQSLQILLVPSNHQDLEEIPFHLSNFKATILPGQKPASTKNP